MRPTKESKYEVILNWSSVDEAFIADVPELPGCRADGKTRKEAAENIEVVIREWIESAKKLRRSIPKPKIDFAISDEKALEFVRKALKKHHKKSRLGVDLMISQDMVRQSDGWLIVIVNPSKEPKRNYDFYDLLAQAEEELSSQDLKIRLLPVLPG